MTEKHSFGSWDPAEAAGFIESFEGRSLTAYKCPAGVWTIGVGHTCGVEEGQTCTDAEADSWLLDDIERAQKALAPFVNVKVTRGQFVALVSLAFNVGASYVSRRCPKLMRALNAGEIEEAAKQFLDITRSGGKVLPGLVRRRRAESALFLGDE